MIALVEGADRQKTPNEIALTILLAGLTIIFLLAVVDPAAVRHLLGRRAERHRARRPAGVPDPDDDRRPAVGDRHRRHGPARAAQRAGDVRAARSRRPATCTTLLLDKTGTITYGSRQASEFIPVTGVTRGDLAEGALVSSLADETPEGRSIVELAVRDFGLTIVEDPDAVLVPFTAQTRMSGMDMTQRPRRSARAPPTRFVASSRPRAARSHSRCCRSSSRCRSDGATPLVVIDRSAAAATVAGPRRDPAEGHREAGHA